MAGTAQDGYKALGSTLAGAGEAPAVYAEAQGENLGANTQSAIAEAKLRQQKYQGRAGMGAALAGLYKDHPEVATALGQAALSEIPFEQVTGSRNQDQIFNLKSTIADPNSSNVARTDAAQAVSSATLANPNADAVGDHLRAQTADERAKATRAPAQNALDAAHAGYFDRSPGAGMAPGIPPLSPELQMHVDRGLLDPRTLNSRNFGIIDQIAKAHPEGFDFNASHSGAVMQSNSTFRQKAAIVDTLPSNIDNMVNLGSKLDYSPVRFAGAAQAYMRGELNDPALAEYMGVRNDTLMKLANTMRGVGMSDKAHQAEIEAASPTMPPGALEAWAHGQLSVIHQQQGQNQNLLHPNLHPGVLRDGAAPRTVNPAAVGPSPNNSTTGANDADKANDPLGIR